MAAGPYRHMLIISAGLTLATVCVHPLGRYMTSPGFIVNVIGVVFEYSGYLLRSTFSKSKVLSTELHSREPLVLV